MGKQGHSNFSSIALRWGFAFIQASILRLVPTERSWLHGLTHGRLSRPSHWRAIAHSPSLMIRLTLLNDGGIRHWVSGSVDQDTVTSPESQRPGRTTVTSKASQALLLRTNKKTNHPSSIRRSSAARRSQPASHQAKPTITGYRTSTSQQPQPESAQ